MVNIYLYLAEVHKISYFVFSPFGVVCHIYLSANYFYTTVIIHLYYNLCLCIGCFICVVYAVKSLSKPEY